MYKILFGVPEMKEKWDYLVTNAKDNKLSKEENRLAIRWSKAIKFLKINPKYPGLNTHEIKPLSKKFGSKVFQSYLENRKPRAMRMYWVYAPPSKTEKYITIIGLEPHPDNKNASYNFVDLSDIPEFKK